MFDCALPLPRNVCVRMSPTGGGRERFGAAVELAVLAEFGPKLGHLGQGRVIGFAQAG